MRERIERHRSERPAAWTTLEEPRRLAAALGTVPEGACAIVDCLSLWVANVLERPAAEIEEEAERAAQTAARRSGRTIAVSNEVGMGIVPANAPAREYRDALGRVNAAWAAASEEAWFVVAGKTLRLS
jgi:adenosyl cobinamide kinase/adenosyl cobinamide phosphate guanylyltransferase